MSVLLLFISPCLLLRVAEHAVFVPTTSVTKHTETVITRRGGKPFLKVRLFTTSSVALYTETAAMPSGEESTYMEGSYLSLFKSPIVTHLSKYIMHVVNS